jgi:hypothetical protein
MNYSLPYRVMVLEEDASKSGNPEITDIAKGFPGPLSGEGGGFGNELSID